MKISKSVILDKYTKKRKKPKNCCNANILIVLIFLSTIFTLNSCSTALNFSYLNPKGELNEKLPSLEPMVDLSSFQNSYLTYGTSSVTNFSTNNGSYSSFGTAITSAGGDKRINDALIYIERDVKTNITDYLSDSKGKIYFKVTGCNYKYKPKTGLIFLGAVLATIPYWTGMNIYKHELMLELDVEIRDSSNKPIARYITVGEGVYETNIYKMRDYRTISIITLKDAMDKLKDRISKDRDKIISKLSN